MHPMLKTALATAVGAVVWLPSMHCFYGVDRAERERTVASLESRALSERTDVDVMRAVNPEWDYMSRTFTVLGLANRALAHAADERRALEAIDRTIETTREEARDADRFLLPYARASRFVDPAARSVFIDGELLMMIAAREAIAREPALDAEASELAASIEGAMRRSPTLSAESYPNECWTFCNTTALAALAILDRVRGTTDHRALARDWVLQAKSRLLDERTGVLVSSFTRDGRVIDGAEGSSIWMSATNLLLVDEAFAKDQYARARHALGATALGLGWARERPSGEPARADVDSGPIVPVLDASAGSSGFAVLGATAFGDDAYRDALLRSLELAGVPRDDASGRRYLASNRVGDAVLFDALSFGPLWRLQ
jgi:hypothetical protein